MDTIDADVVVIGGGIAGASAGWALANDLSVVVVEAEDAAGRHATGRSAAFYFASYGNAPVRALNRASFQDLIDPPPGFARPLIRPRGAVHVAEAGQTAALEPIAEAIAATGGTPRPLGEAELHSMVPALAACFVNGLAEDGGYEIDVAALHQSYLHGLTSAGGQLLTGCRIERIEPHGVGFALWTGGSDAVRLSCRILINAAGAWADSLASLAGVRPIGLAPLRRTAILVPQPDFPDVARWPLVSDATDRFYFKPDSGLMLVSAATEDPDVPSDVQPDALDIALAAEAWRIATGALPPRIASRWAGLRTFAPDRTPVVGPDPEHPGFIWCAGQGGYGIQTAPAMASLVRWAVLGAAPPTGVDPACTSPARFATTACSAAAAAPLSEKQYH